MPITEGQESTIRQEIITAYKIQFGEENWTQNLMKNLRPSPLKSIAQMHGVPLKAVQQIKHDFWLAGMLMNVAAAMPSTMVSVS